MACAQVMGPNGLVARHDLVGVYATKASRRPRDVAGDKLQVGALALNITSSITRGAPKDSVGEGGGGRRGWYGPGWGRGSHTFACMSCD